MAYLGHIGRDGSGGLEPPGGDRRWGARSWSRVPGGTCVRVGKEGKRNENVAGRGHLGRCVQGGVCVRIGKRRRGNENVVESEHRRRKE